MNKSVNPILALAIILLFGGIFGLYFYFLQQAADAPKINYLKNSPSGNVIIRHGTDFYDYTPNGEFNQVFNLDSIGISGNLGDFDFFSNGDLLIQANPVGEAGLYRCDMVLQTCRIFSADIPKLGRVHHLFIDQETDTVLVADTQQHQIFKLNPDGKLLASIKEGLRFPNQVWLEDNALWLLDSDNYAIKKMSAENISFGELIETYEAKEQNSARWPSAHTKVNDVRWIDIANGIMGKARVALFDADWDKIKTLRLPLQADPVDTLYTGKSVLIVDPYQYTVYQFDTDGNRIDDFAKNEITADGIQQAFIDSKLRTDKFDQWSLYCLFAAAFAFIAILPFALWQAKKEEESTPLVSASPEALIELETLPSEGLWIGMNPIFKHFPFIILIFSFASAGYFWFAFSDIAAEKDSLIKLWGLIGLLILINIALAISLRKQFKQQLGFFKDYVSYRDNKNNIHSQAYDQIKWHKNGQLFIDGKQVITKIFPSKVLQQRLRPYLLYRNHLSQKELQKHIWKQQSLFQKILLGLLLIYILIRIIMIFTS